MPYKPSLRKLTGLVPLKTPARELRPAGVLTRLSADTSGNAIMLTTAGLLPLLAIIGGGVDMSRGYAAEGRLQQACDAGALAARKTLGTEPNSEPETLRAVEASGMEFFDFNFPEDQYNSPERSFQMTVEPDFTVSAVASTAIPTTVMTVFGYTEMPISVTCSAQLNMSDTDILLVIDSTTSMRLTNSGDTLTRIDTLRQVLGDFYTQVETSKAPGSKVRYGFLPYSSNVNVGGLLQSDWMVDEWTYQSRLPYDSGLDNTIEVPANYTFSVGAYTGTQTRIDEYVSETCPADTLVTGRTDPVDISTDPHEYYEDETKNGIDYSCTETDGLFLVSGTEYTDYNRRWTYRQRDAYTITSDIQHNDYLPRTFDVSSTNGASGSDPTVIGATIAEYVGNFNNIWLTSYSGCIEERSTYEIDDFDNVDLSRALDLNIDLVPTPANADTQWRPMFPGFVYARKLGWSASGTFEPEPVLATTSSYVRPADVGDISACPSPARKLGEMTEEEFNGYLDGLVMAGQTYHDIGMIWGGRMLSPTGIFASENATGDRETTRHLIFLTDGATEAFDLAYGAYGVEPLDQRRWREGSAISLNETVEKRFAFACNEVKKRNITIWVIGFGTELNPIMTSCAGPGRSFEASNASELTAAFDTIVNSVADLRVTG